MDVELDNDKVYNELEVLDPYFVSHRDLDKTGGYGHGGWSGITLHGIDYDKTESHEQYGFNTEEEANYYDSENGGSGTSHIHVYADDPTNTSWYMPDTNGVMNGTSAPLFDLSSNKF